LATRAEWPVMRGPVIYARADDGVSIWDPLRHDLYGKHDPRSLPALQLSPAQLEHGLVDERDRTQSRCNGLLRDWESWRRNDPELFDVFFAVVGELFASEDGSTDTIKPGPTLQLFD
jgi:hypothetical protein